MESTGLLKRIKESPDRRFTRILITEKGRDAYRTLFSANVVRQVISQLGDKDKDCLARCLKFIREESLRSIYKEIENRSVTAKLGYIGTEDFVNGREE
jgi:DNA-binding MarR family transcriptional regulator